MAECGTCGLFNAGQFRTSLANRCACTVCQETRPANVTEYCLVPFNEETTTLPVTTTPPDTTLPPSVPSQAATLPPFQINIGASPESLLQNVADTTTTPWNLGSDDSDGQLADLSESGSDSLEKAADLVDGASGSSVWFGVGAGLGTTAFVVTLMVISWLVLYVFRIMPLFRPDDKSSFLCSTRYRLYLSEKNAKGPRIIVAESDLPPKPSRL